MTDTEPTGADPVGDGPWSDEEIDSWMLPVDPATNTEEFRMRRMREGFIWPSGTPAEEIVAALHADADEERP